MSNKATDTGFYWMTQNEDTITFMRYKANTREGQALPHGHPQAVPPCCPLHLLCASPRRLEFKVAALPIPWLWLPAAVASVCEIRENRKQTGAQCMAGLAVLILEAFLLLPWLCFLWTIQAGCLGRAEGEREGETPRSSPCVASFV